MQNLQIPVDLIWGKNDPWEPINEAYNWESSLECIRSLEVIDNVGQCHHDEAPERVNQLILKVFNKQHSP